MGFCRFLKTTVAITALSLICEAKLKGNDENVSNNKNVDLSSPSKQEETDDYYMYYDDDEYYSNVPAFYCPAERYIEWSKLPTSVDAQYLVASQNELHYDEEYWNQFNSPVEAMSWDSLYDDMIAAGKIMGYDEDRWNCCINHYENFSFKQLKKKNPRLEVAAKILGWDKNTWEAVDSTEELPESEGKKWDELIALEQTAADILCYDEDTWNKNPLPWDLSRPKAPANEIDFMCPTVRYEEWNKLTTEQLYAALDLGYDENTWSNYRNPIEQLSFEEVSSEHDWKEALNDLGYDVDTWDCCLNNYASYNYHEIKNYNSNYPLLEHSVNALGWTESTWASDNPDDWPDSEFKYWNELSDIEIAAADYLCYYEASWNDPGTIGEDLS